MALVKNLVIPELALKRYTDFIESFNNFKLVDHKVDATSINPEEKLRVFYETISKEPKLFKYLLNKDKILFHKNYKLVFLPKINFYNIIDSNIDEQLIAFIWETVQMIYLIIADNQENKNQAQVDALLDKLDTSGKKKGKIDLKKLSNIVSKLNSGILTEFLQVSGLDKIDVTNVDVSQFKDMKNLNQDSVKNLLSQTGFDKIDFNEVMKKLSEKGDKEKGKKYILELIEKLIDEYERAEGIDKMDNVLDFAIEKTQDRIDEFISEGSLNIYDLVAGSKFVKEDTDLEINEKLKKSKLYKDCSTIQIKDLMNKFMSRLMTQMGKDKANGTVSEEQMKNLEEFLKNQKI